MVTSIFTYFFPTSSRSTVLPLWCLAVALYASCCFARIADEHPEPHEVIQEDVVSPESQEAGYVEEVLPSQPSSDQREQRLKALEDRVSALEKQLSAQEGGHQALQWATPQPALMPERERKGWKVAGPMPSSTRQKIDQVPQILGQGVCTKARGYLAQGKVEDARRVLQQAAQAGEKDNPEVSYLLGAIALWKDKNYGQARSLFAHAYILCHDKPSSTLLALATLVRLAEISLHQGKEEEARSIRQRYHKRSQELRTGPLTPEAAADLRALDAEEKALKKAP